MTERRGNIDNPRDPSESASPEQIDALRDTIKAKLELPGGDTAPLKDVKYRGRCFQPDDHTTVRCDEYDGAMSLTIKSLQPHGPDSRLVEMRYYYPDDPQTPYQKDVYLENIFTKERFSQVPVVPEENRIVVDALERQVGNYQLTVARYNYAMETLERCAQQNELPYAEAIQEF